MTPLAARLTCGAALLIWAAAMVSLLGGVSSYGQADPAGTFREMAPRLLSRTLFTTNAEGIRIEIVDLIVGPERISGRVSLKEAALLDVQGGEALLIVDGKAQPIKPGDVLSLMQDQTITIDNSNAPRPLVARLIKLSRQIK